MSNINLFSQFDETSGEDHGYKNGHHECKEEEEDLIVFGYSCKLFRDDFSAKAIDRGQSLIPWNGDENVMIDRYDCRSHLFDLKPWDSDLIRLRQSEEDETILDENQRRIEEECEQERYADLYRDVEKEMLQQEEEAKRNTTDKNSFHQVGFTYDQSKESINKPTEEPLPTPDDDEYEPFYPSEKLQIPYGMEIPESIKLNAVIEKTASFVSNSGLQMEIVLKTKQSNNPQFDFLKYDHYLNPYYRHLIIMIKSGKYRPNVDNQSTNSTQKKKTTKNGVDHNSSHDEDEGNDSYLHPLLRGGATNDNSPNNQKKTDELLRTPSVPMNIHNTAYGQLIKKYEHLRQREKIIKDNDEEKMSTASDEMKNEDSSPLPSESSPSPSPTVVIPPPPDVKPIIDKLAEYVARNGTAFEQSIRTKNDPRFGFIERDHIHHNYYQLKVQLCSQAIQRKAMENQQSNDEQRVHRQRIKLILKTNHDGSSTPISSRDFQFDEDSNSIPPQEQGEFIGPRPPSPEFLEKMRKQEQRRDRVMEFVREKILREKQEERKRKAEMLIQQLKDKPTQMNPSTESNINPVLVEKLLNVKNDRSTGISSKHSKSHRRSRSRSHHRRSKRSSHRRSRSRSKSRNHYRSKRSKNSKSGRHRRRHHRRSSSSSSSSSRSSRSSSSSNKTQPKKNPQSSKWDQREPMKTKSETITVSSTTNDTTISNSTLSSS